MSYLRQTNHWVPFKFVWLFLLVLIFPGGGHLGWFPWGDNASCVLIDAANAEAFKAAMVYSQWGEFSALSLHAYHFLPDGVLFANF